MTERERVTDPATESDSGDLTRQIKALSPSSLESGAETASAAPRALLICRDKSSKKWGERWLTHSGFQLEYCDAPNEALDLARRFGPDVILVEAALGDPSGVSTAAALQQAEDINASLIALANSTPEVVAMLDVGVFDVASKPFDWQLVARRAKKAIEHIRLVRELEETRNALASAVGVADAARKRLRSSESMERITGLPNRGKFVDLVARGVHTVRGDGNALVVFAIGMSRFRLVVDALGPRYSEKVSAEIGARLNGSLRELGDANAPSKGLNTGAVADLGNGRFALMLTCDDTERAILALPRQLGEIVNRPATIGGQTINISTRIGAAYCPRDAELAEDAEKLVTRAEIAMHSAQERGTNFKFYSAAMDAAAARRLELERMIHDGIEKNEFRLAYQPLNDVGSDKIVATEALLRWPQSDGSFIPPDEFVPIAEESGLMLRLGEFVLREACRQLAEWREHGLTELRMCVNVSRCQLVEDDFPNLVQDCLTEHDIPAGDLDLELSERGVLTGDGEITRRLTELKKLGVSLSIDDFGIGESAIAYLKQLPVDTLKIDRSYINGLLDDGRDTAMTSAMIALAQKLDLSVVAEGVETPEQLSKIRAFGCDQYQGFLRSPAVEPAKFLALLTHG